MYIRLLTEHDVIPFQTLRLRGLQETPDAFAITSNEFQQEALPQMAERLRLEGDPPEQFVLGAFESEDTLIGMVGFFRETLSKMRHKATVWGMYVAPEFRGQGIGKRLLEDLAQAKCHASRIGANSPHSCHHKRSCSSPLRNVGISGVRSGASRFKTG